MPFFLRASVLPRLPLRLFSLRCPPSPTHIARRHQSGFQFPGGQQRPKYNRFSRAHQVQYLWYNSPAFRYGTGALGVGAVGFVGYNLERVPVSDTEASYDQRYIPRQGPEVGVMTSSTIRSANASRSNTR